MVIPERSSVEPDRGQDDGPVAQPLTVARLAVVIAASVPFVSGLFWLYLYAVYTAYYGTFGVTLEQVGLTQSVILARAGGRALLGVVVIGGPYFFVIVCARAILDAGSRSSWVLEAFSSSSSSLRRLSDRPAGARVPAWFIYASCAALALVGLASFVLAVRWEGTAAVLPLALLALTVLMVALAVLGVDTWDRGTWWRSVLRYLRLAAVALAVLVIGVVSYTSVGAARGAALETLGVPVQDSLAVGSLLPSLERGAVAVLASPGTEVVEVEVRPLGEDVAGLCRADGEVRYRRLGWTSDVLTLVEQRRETATTFGAQAFSVITVPSDAYSVRTTLQPSAASSGSCF